MAILRTDGPPHQLPCAKTAILRTDGREKRKSRKGRARKGGAGRAEQEGEKQRERAKGRNGKGGAGKREAKGGMGRRDGKREVERNDLLGKAEEKV